jgi:uncharacterized protein YfdQ (DUF2303 family)
MTENITAGERDVAAAILAGSALVQPRNLTGFIPYTLVPDGMKVEKLERLLDPERPQRAKASPSFDDAASLVAYFNRFKDGQSTLFADIDSSTVRAVIDHHQASEGARYHDHKASFTAKHSLEWLTWVKNSGNRMSQEQFAVFIEDNAPDVKVPTAVDLYQMALSLEAAGKSEFKSHKRLEDGSISFTFVDEVNGTSNGMPFPKQMEVLLRPYIGCTAVPLIAKLRFRNDGGKLSLWYDLLRHEQVKREAFDAIVESIASETETFVLKGRPA